MVRAVAFVEQCMLYLFDIPSFAKERWRSAVSARDGWMLGHEVTNLFFPLISSKVPHAVEVIFNEV